VKRGLSRWLAALALLVTGACLDFDGAVEEYCTSQPDRCANLLEDAGLLPDGGRFDGGGTDSDAGTDAGVDGGATDSDAGADGGPDAGIDSGTLDGGGDDGGTVVVTPPDAGPAGPCSSGTCPLGQTCQYPARNCEPALSCSIVTGFQPGTCARGQVCTNGFCNDVPPPSCDHFRSDAGHGNSWTPASTGHIIFSATGHTLVADQAFCAGTTYRARVTVNVYAGDGGTIPGNGADIAAQLHNVRPAGTEGAHFVTGIIRGNADRNITFDVNACPADLVPYTFGLHFLDGNPFCVTATP
jgi:hypothetical protein